MMHILIGCIRFGIVIAAAAFVSTAGAESVRLPLTAAEVLASSQRHFPLILQALAGQRAAQGRALEAEGAFDVVFSADGFSRVGGFYDGNVIDGVAKQRLRPLGVELYTGYKLSDGTFPVYEDANFTNTGGTLRVGALFALLRDRAIDQERFAETDARLGLAQADLDVLLTKVGVQQRALDAYLRWVNVGRQFKVFENLLRIAQERQDSLAKQVASGARAEIFLTENLQNITRRQGLVTSAQRDINFAANALSYYYRGEEGAPATPDISRLPEQSPRGQIGDLDIRTDAATSEALLRRPELALLRTAIEREQNRIALSENNLKPRIDFDVGVQKGLGSVAEGGPSRDSTDTVVGFQFSVPLQRNAARGRLMQARAELDAIRQQQQLQEEQIQIEVRNILLEFDVAKELLSLAMQEAELSETMRLSEVQRFESGASDFFLVNLREETAANAQIKVLQAELDARLARVNFDTVTVDLERLGLSASDLSQ